ncbi:hypothetical protein [Nocardia camponoti]|uniref:DUF3558 domain-containing protein n=1 Tax=Nocardia camponoti TaxID=1616106 RepID=A0A917Q790_9NOCA|nr:hypothetical protein [Nocardia camponoti]GGK32684.1 hypothetical protein GCM10011591_00500 [Nocardia camponoti]
MKQVRGTIYAAVATVFVVLFAGGCVSEADSARDLPPIGDIATLDPCGFIPADTFADITDVKPEIAVRPTNFVRCSLRLDLVGRQDDRVAVWTIMSAHTTDLDSTDAVSTTRGGIRIAKGTSNEGAWCDGSVRLPNGAGVVVHAAADRNGRPLSDVNACPVRDRAVDAIVATMRAGKYQRIPYAGDSLRGYALCSALSVAEVRSALTMPGLIDQSVAAEHDCQWRTVDESERPPGAMMSVWIDDPSIYLGNRVTINGFAGRAWDISQSDTGRCIVTIAVKNWDPWPGLHRAKRKNNLAEILYTQVILPNQSEPGRACEAAKTIAGQALSRRPAS